VHAARSAAVGDDRLLPLVLLSALPDVWLLVIDLALLGLGGLWGGLPSWAPFKRPLVIGLLFAFGWESGHGAARLPETVHHRLLHPGPGPPCLGRVAASSGDVPGKPTDGGLPGLFSRIWAFLYLATRVVERKSILEQ
jgi:hypothetical protein